MKRVAVFSSRKIVPSHYKTLYQLHALGLRPRPGQLPSAFIAGMFKNIPLYNENEAIPKRFIFHCQTCGKVTTQDKQMKKINLCKQCYGIHPPTTKQPQ